MAGKCRQGSPGWGLRYRWCSRSRWRCRTGKHRSGMVRFGRWYSFDWRICSRRCCLGVRGAMRLAWQCLRTRSGRCGYTGEVGR